MKRVLSIVLSVIMLASICLVTPIVGSAADSSSSSSSSYTLYNNSSIDILKYNGSLSYVPVNGTRVSLAEKKSTIHIGKDGYSTNGYVYSTTPTTIKSSTDSDATIVLDGLISEEEWGTPTLDLSSEYASTNKKVEIADAEEDGRSVDLNHTQSSAENTYYFRADQETNRTVSQTIKTNGYSATIWLRWDDDYLYIAAIVNDPDGFTNTPANLTDLWIGDSFQIRVDPNGPNSGVDGGEYNGLNWLSDEYSASCGYPWKGSVRAETVDDGGTRTNYSTNETYATVGNFSFGYEASAGTVISTGLTTPFSSSGMSAGYDMAYRYDPTEKEITDPDTGEVTGTTTVYSQKNMDADNDYGKSYQSILPVINTETGAVDTENYEIALPWSQVTENGANPFSVTAGSVLGMAMVLLDGSDQLTTTETSNKCYLSWGSGICSSQMTYDPQTAGGSNAGVLSDTLWNDTTVCDHSAGWNDPTCTEGYTCKNCGYERGFANGHTYEVQSLDLPAGTTAGSSKMVCSVCGDTKEVTINDNKNSIISQWSENSNLTTDLENNQFFGGWGTDYIKDSYLAPFDSTLNGHVDASGNPNYVLSNDGTSYRKYATTYDGSSVIDFTYTTDLFYCYAKDGVEVSHTDVYINNDESQGKMLTGTKLYNITGSKMEKSSYIYNVDVDFTTAGFTSNTDYNTSGSAFFANDERTNGFYVFFGGGNQSTSVGMSYIAGFFVKPGTSTGRFIIATEDGKNFDKKARTADEEASHTANGDVVIQDENGIMNSDYILAMSDEMTLNEDQWYNFAFVLDLENNIAAVGIDKTLYAAAYNEDFSYDTYSNFNDGINLITWASGCAYYLKNPTLESIGYETNADGTASAYTYKNNSTPVTYTATVTNGTGSGKYSEGDTVTISDPVVATGYKFLKWTGDSTVTFADSKASSTTFVMPASDVTIAHTDYLPGDCYSSGTVNAIDVLFLRKYLVNAVDASTLTDVQLAAMDMNGDGSINAADLLYLRKRLVGLI